MPTKNRQILLASRPTGEPTPDNFRLVEAEIPSPGPGQMLLRSVYLSLDPYMRGRMNAAKSYARPVDSEGHLMAEKASESERRGEKLFFGKAKCASCHPAPFYLDHQMHDLRLERFVDEAGRGPIKTFTLRGIKESPPYLHDGRCFTLQDTVEFFNLVLELRLDVQEKTDLAAFMRQL